MKRSENGLLENPITGNFDIKRGRGGRFVSKSDRGAVVYGRTQRQATYQHKGNCLQCGKAFTGSRSSRKYCSVNCRVAATRDRKVISALGLSPTHQKKLTLIQKYSPRSAALCKSYLARQQTDIAQDMIDVAFDGLMLYVEELQKRENNANGGWKRFLKRK